MNCTDILAETMCNISTSVMDTAVEMHAFMMDQVYHILVLADEERGVWAPPVSLCVWYGKTTSHDTKY